MNVLFLPYQDFVPTINDLHILIPYLRYFEISLLYNSSHLSATSSEYVLVLFPSDEYAVNTTVYALDFLVNSFDSSILNPSFEISLNEFHECKVCVVPYGITYVAV